MYKDVYVYSKILSLCTNSELYSNYFSAYLFELDNVYEI